MKGTIRNISVAGMLRLLCNYGKTGKLNVSDSSIKGFIEMQDGEITSASVISSKTVLGAEQAVIRLLQVMGEGTFYFEEGSFDTKKPAGISVEKVIMESARELYRSGIYKTISVEDFLFPENEVMKVVYMPSGKKLELTFESDEWNLLTAFNGDSNISSALNTVKAGKEKAQVMLYGLVAAGLIRRTRFKIPEIAKIARDNMGNIGAAIVDNELSRLHIDKTKMGMKELIAVLNSLEFAFAEIVGRTRARDIIEKIWSGTK